jgi:hypothetical protein
MATCAAAPPSIVPVWSCRVETFRPSSLAQRTVASGDCPCLRADFPCRRTLRFILGLFSLAFSNWCDPVFLFSLLFSLKQGTFHRPFRFDEHAWHHDNHYGYNVNWNVWATLAALAPSMHQAMHV